MNSAGMVQERDGRNSVNNAMVICQMEGNDGRDSLASTAWKPSAMPLSNNLENAGQAGPVSISAHHDSSEVMEPI